MTNFHQELIPTELLFSILASRENVPFPVIFEILVMEISFELIREAGLRVPSPIGPTIGIVGALGTAMLPRLSNLITTGQKEEFNRLAQKSMQFVIAITLPMTVGIIMTSSYLIPLFCGDTYTPAILTLQVISPIILAIGISNIMGIQILYPQGQENKVIISTALGAIANFFLNVWLIPQLAQDGAAIATVIAEIAVTVSMVYIGRTYIPIKWRNRSYIHYLIGSFLMGIGIWIWKYQSPFRSDIVNLAIVCGIGISIYLFYLILIKDSFCTELESIICKRFKSNS